ncbi:MAG: formyltransferase family protein [Saprospiraceae bacterium]
MCMYRHPSTYYHITGMTIHLVNEKYDEGQILFQAQCKVDADDTRNSSYESPCFRTQIL